MTLADLIAAHPIQAWIFFSLVFLAVLARRRSYVEHISPEQVRARAIARSWEGTGKN